MRGYTTYANASALPSRLRGRHMVALYDVAQLEPVLLAVNFTGLALAVYFLGIFAAVLPDTAQVHAFLPRRRCAYSQWH